MKSIRNISLLLFVAVNYIYGDCPSKYLKLMDSVENKKIYHENYMEYFKLVRCLEDEALKCENPQKMTEFIKIAIASSGCAECDGYFDEIISATILEKPKCFLSGFYNLSEKNKFYWKDIRFQNSTTYPFEKIKKSVSVYLNDKKYGNDVKLLIESVPIEQEKDNKIIDGLDCLNCKEVFSENESIVFNIRNSGNNPVSVSLGVFVKKKDEKYHGYSQDNSIVKISSGEVFSFHWDKKTPYLSKEELEKKGNVHPEGYEKKYFDIKQGGDFALYVFRQVQKNNFKIIHKFKVQPASKQN